jgi:hypothetical protein
MRMTRKKKAIAITVATRAGMPIAGSDHANRCEDLEAAPERSGAASRGVIGM